MQECVPNTDRKWSAQMYPEKSWLSAGLTDEIPLAGYDSAIRWMKLATPSVFAPDRSTTESRVAVWG
jgi:hypothetical protein